MISLPFSVRVCALFMGVVGVPEEDWEAECQLQVQFEERFSSSSVPQGTKAGPK